MTHEEIQDLLEDYVDDRLDRQTRREVDEHLKTCEECRSILDEVAPVDISSFGPSRYDERAMRRTVRRSIFRTAWNTAIILLAGWILLWVFSAFIFQPLVISRGGRAADAARATIDVTSMITPGAVVSGGHTQSGLFSREMTFDVVLPVGSGVEDLGPVETRLGVFSLTGPEGASPWPYLGSQTFQDARDQIHHLGPGTVATLQIDFTSPLTVDDAQAIVDTTTYDMSVVWAGFDVRKSQSQPYSIASGGMLGYGTCEGTDDISDEMLGATSFGFNTAPTAAPSSMDGALDSVIAGLENLENHPEWLENLTYGEADENEVATVIDELTTNPLVRTLVVTGPSDQIARFLSSNDDNTLSAQILAVDFYNWAPGMCGR